MKILLAFSDPLLGSMFRAQLTDYKCSCTTVETVEEFVAVSQNTGFDFVVTTFFEPFLSGRDLASKIRAVSHPARTSILLICPFHYEQTLVSLYESGVDQYITLPLNVERVARKIIARI